MKVNPKALLEAQQEAVKVQLRKGNTPGVNPTSPDQGGAIAKQSGTADVGVTASVFTGMPTEASLKAERRQRVEELSALYRAGKLKPAPSQDIAKKMVEESFFDRALGLDKIAENE